MFFFARQIENIWKVYLTALLMIGCLLIMILAVSEFFTTRIKENASYIYIVKQQITLSQKIAAAAQDIADHSLQGDEKEDHLSLLKEHRESFAKFHESLIQASKDLQLSNIANYEDIHQLDHQVGAFLSSVDIILSDRPESIKTEALSQVQDYSRNELLSSLDTFAKRLQIKARDFKERYVLVKRIFMISALILLSLGWLYIFKPLNSFVIKSLEDKEKSKDRAHLQEQMAIEGADLGVWDTDLETGFTFYSDRWISMLGYELDEIEHHFSTWESLVHPDDVESCLKTFQDHLKGKTEQYEIEHRLRAKDGSWKWILSRGRVFERNEEGRATRAIGTHLDISEKKETEQELAEYRENLERLVEEKTENYLKAKVKAEKASKAKDEFLANMSHELRTPLNSILGLTKILLRGKLSAKQKESLGVIDKASQSLLKTVNNILDLSKIEAETAVLEKKSFNIASLFKDVLQQVSPLASEKGINLDSNIKQMGSLFLIGDPFRLERIFINLIGNAVKFTEEGQVKINVDLLRRGGDRVLLECTVSDTGIGIPADKIDYIFEKFTQSDETTERFYGGTGLGLNITKKLVTMMNGTIDVKSQEKEGSVFTVRIPFEIYEKQKHGSGAQDSEKAEASFSKSAYFIRKPIEECRVLVAEDNEFNVALVQQLLDQVKPHETVFVKNGLEAVEAFSERDFDFVLMDCHMPEMDGYVATRHMRQYEQLLSDKEGGNPFLRKRRPIVALTADAMQETETKCFDAGMDAYISKPIDEDVFYETLERWFLLNHASSHATVTQISKGDTAINLKVLEKYSGGSSETLKKLALKFVEKTKADLEVMQKEIDSQDNSQWCAIAHKLKGSAAYVGADQLVDMLDNIQHDKTVKPTEKKQGYDRVTKMHEDIYDDLKRQHLI